MFDYIEGKLVDIEPNYAVVHVAGWGVKMSVSLNTYERIKTMNQGDVRLFVHMVIKDDYIDLIGFEDSVEREAFILLNRVSGIGTKVGLAVLSFFDVSKLKSCILEEDATSLVKVPGIGKKTAQRMIIELKDKIKDLPVQTQEHSYNVDLIEAKEVLTSLGFSFSEVRRVIGDLPEKQLCNGVEEIVKNALKQLSR